MIEKNICDCNGIHDEIINRVKLKMIKDEVIEDIGQFFKVFGDGTRLKIMNALLHEEMCVCDIAKLLNMSQSSISHQLRVLRQSKIVKNRRDGKVMYYSLDDEHIRAILDQGIAHYSHHNKMEE